MLQRREFIRALACTGFLAGSSWLRAVDAQKLTAAESLAEVGDSPDVTGPHALDLSPRIKSQDIKNAMQKVGSWELARTSSAFNDDWTFAALYAGLLAAGQTLQDSKYENAMVRMGDKLHWKLGTDEL